MQYYTGAFKKYADFSGRARRKEYWMFTLVNGYIILIPYTITMIFFAQNIILLYTGEEATFKTSTAIYFITTFVMFLYFSSIVAKSFITGQKTA